MSVLPRVAFDRESIRTFVPQERPTVYRITDVDGEVVYLGASCQPRRRLLEHLRGGKPGVFVALEFFRTTTAMARAEANYLAVLETRLPAGFGRRHASWKAQPKRSRRTVQPS